MQIIRRPIHWLRRVIGIPNVIHALSREIGSLRTDLTACEGRRLDDPNVIHPLIREIGDLRADLGAHETRQLDDLRQYLDEKVADLQFQVAQDAAGLAPQVAEILSAKREVCQPPIPRDLLTLYRLSQPAEPDEQLGLSDLSELEELSRKGLFVVGNARSGTGILFRCLNLSRDVYLMGEANLFFKHREPDFRSWHNQEHKKVNTPPYKGTFLPEPPIPLRGGLAYLAWLARHYRYVGEKLAFGPGNTVNGVPFQDVFFEFQSRFFFLATYVLIVRAPAECVWSMHKMFPSLAIESLIECWLRSLNLCIDLYSVFPNCHLILLENLTAQTIAHISQVLQTDIPLPAKMLSDEAQKSRLPKAQIPEVLADFRGPLQDCSEIYDCLASLFSPHTLRYDSEHDPVVPLPEALKPRIARVLDSVVPGSTCLKYKIAG
jgi:hypothetical protein